MKEMKLTVVVRILMFCSLLNVLCFPLLGEDVKQAATKPEDQALQKEETCLIERTVR